MKKVWQQGKEEHLNGLLKSIAQRMDRVIITGGGHTVKPRLSVFQGTIIIFAIKRGYLIGGIF